MKDKEMREQLKQKLRVTRFENTSVYQRTNVFILSPYVGKLHGWFDIRKANIDKKQEEEHAYLIVRHYDFGFIIFNYEQFVANLITSDVCTNAPHNDKPWRFLLKQSSSGDTYYAQSRHDKAKKYTADSCSLDDLSIRLP